MKLILKKIYFFFILMGNTIKSIVCVFLFSSFSTQKSIAKIKKTIQHNKPCYILGNGPSLKKIFNLQTIPFMNEDTLVVNFFYKSKYFNLLMPKYYFIIDTIFIESKNSTYFDNMKKDLIKHFLEINWKMIFFVPYETDRKFLDQISKNKNITIIKFNRTPVSGYRKLIYYLFTHGLGMPLPANVLNGALYMMLSLGYTKIYLYGADFSWIKDLTVNEKNQVCCYQNHLYDDKHELYVMPKNSLKEGLQGIVDALNSFSILNDYSLSKKAKVINKTKGSFIDIFDYIEE